MIKLLYSSFILLLSIGPIQAQNAYHFEGRMILAGTKENFIIPIAFGNDSTLFQLQFSMV
jgi:hypothetical protein